MKLTNQILHALRGRKRDTEETRLGSLLKAALPHADAELKAAELKLEEFKKELLSIRKEGKRIEEMSRAHTAKYEKLQEQIKNKLGHNFYYELGKGIRRNYGYNSPEQMANSALQNIIDSALVDLQLDCLGKKDEALKNAIDDFNNKPLAEKAVEDVLARLKERQKD